MKSIQFKSDPRVESLIDSYPPKAKKRLYHLRDLIIESAAKIKGMPEIEETLKWGEPSYVTKKGSTIRMDWKSKAPEQYAMYFTCSTRLVETFRMIYGDLFKYEKNRALIFGLDDELPESQLKECITMSLRYHELKDQPLLGH